MRGNERYGVDIGELVQETLEVLEKSGGEDAFIHIKHVVPTYDKAIQL